MPSRWQQSGETPDALWTVTDVHELLKGGYEFVLQGPGSVQRTGGVSLMGRFNVANAALAQLMLKQCGIEAAAAARGIAACRGCPGGWSEWAQRRWRWSSTTPTPPTL